MYKKFLTFSYDITLTDVINFKTDYFWLDLG